MTREKELINKIREYLNSGMWQYSSCSLNKEDLEIIVKALEQEPLEVETAKLQKAYDKGFEDCARAVIAMAKREA